MPRPLVVMLLVGMDDDDIAFEAVQSRTAVVEGLHAGQGVADGIGVVPVRIVGVAGEKGFEPLEPRLRRSVLDPIAARGTARS